MLLINLRIEVQIQCLKVVQSLETFTEIAQTFVCDIRTTKNHGFKENKVFYLAKLKYTSSNPMVSFKVPAKVSKAMSFMDSLREKKVRFMANLFSLQVIVFLQNQFFRFQIIFHLLDFGQLHLIGLTVEFELFSFIWSGTAVSHYFGR